jgi:hypothetical protein
VPSIDPARFFYEPLESASPDLLRELLSTFIEVLMSAEADAICGAPYATSSPERVNVRNGYRHRDFDTRAGTLDVAIPKLRSGSAARDLYVAPDGASFPVGAARAETEEDDGEPSARLGRL